MTTTKRSDVASAARATRNARKRGKVSEIRDRRRFLEAPVATGIVKRMADPGETGTVYPHTLRDWSPDMGETILKSGLNNSKIGGGVLKGYLKGAAIFTLSLEERATCPTSCALWRECYGNQMDKARRWKHSRALEDALEVEVADLCEKHEAVLIRLHVLGDFPTWRYLCLWAELLDRHDNLHVFGFTAHAIGTKMGDGIARLRAAMGSRFSIRHSNRTGAWGSFTLDFPTEKTRIGDAIVCPEQRMAISAPERGVHCGTCALCWSNNHPIAFIEH